MPAAVPSTGARSDAALFATMLLDIALKPVSDEIGVLGSAVTDGVAAHIARAAFESPS